MRKAYSYIRFSSKAQEDGDSLRRQTEATRQYCENNNLELDNSFQDLGKSGFRKRDGNSEQEALSKFIELCEEGQIENDAILIVENLDRLSRDNVKSALQQFLKILDFVDVYTLQDEKLYKKNSKSIDFDLIISITIMSRAHEESSTKSERLSQVWSNKRNNLTKTKATSNGPHWLKLSKDKTEWIVIQERAEVIKLIFELAMDCSSTKIVKHLNDNGYKSPRGKLWAKTSVSRILTDKCVLGEYQPHIGRGGYNRTPIGEVIKDYYPQVIQEDLFYAVQAARESRKQTERGRGGEKFSNLLRNIAICKKCGSPMEFKNKGPKPKGGQYLTCSLATRTTNQCDNDTHVSYPEIEQAILLLLARKQLINDYKTTKKKRIDILALEGEKVTKEKKLNSLLKTVENIDEPRPQIFKSIEKIDIEISKLERDIAEAKIDDAKDKTEINLNAIIQDITNEKDNTKRVKNRKALNKFLIENLGKAKVACLNPDKLNSKKRIVEITFDKQSSIVMEGYRYIHLNNTTCIDLKDNSQALKTIEFHSKNKTRRTIPLFKEH
ncbi:TPA: recombinase family protein [Vibrio alginolyticus]|nr:recombinase family protein [Vibrio parahaemolyticus]MBE4191246.1 recombinase family protein [Vibrio parahaemolyticus]HCZ9052323.1 recombinase family protein [Vibrio alginolyticus]